MHCRQFACHVQVAFPLYFIVHTPSYATLRRIENLNGLYIVFYSSHSIHQVTLQRIENLNGFLTVFYCSTPNTRGNPTYNLTTDQCGARSGLPQLLTSNNMVDIELLNPLIRPHKIQ